MRFKKSYFVSSVLLCVFFSIAVAGCDFIDTVKEYLQGSKSSSTMETPAPMKALPAEKPTAAAPSSSVPLAATSPNVLAQVGNWTITRDEFNDRLKALKEVAPNFDPNDVEAKKMVLEELVRQQLLVEEAQRVGLPNQKDIDAAVQEFRRTLIVQEMVKKLTAGLTVTDEEVRAFYDAQKDLLVEPAQWHLRILAVADKVKANELALDLSKGADFAETARQNSIDPSAAKGGDLGFITEAPFPEMANAVLPLKAGEISGVFKGPKGYYIAKLEEKKEGAPLAFDDIKDEIKQNQMLLKQQQAVLDHIEQLKRTTKIFLKEDNL